MRMPGQRCAGAIVLVAALLLVAGCGEGGHHPAGLSFDAGLPAPVGAPTLFVSPTGDEQAPCSRAEPCRDFDTAYHRAAPGTVVEVAGGRYGNVKITADPAKNTAGCESERRTRSCVVFVPAPGSHVAIDELDLGGAYTVPGPEGVMFLSGAGRRLTTGSTNLVRAGDVVLWNVEHRTLYITGGHDLAIRGGEVGGLTSSDGTHPEIQRVYHSNPLIVPLHVTIEGVTFHDINTTSPTAHVDCLQVENGTDIVIRRNRFERCGSVGLRMSYGAEAEVGPPTSVLIEDNVFGPCAPTPASPCYFAAQLGVGRDVLIRRNTATQALQETGDARLAHAVRYDGNRGAGIACESFITYTGNSWASGNCER